MQRVFFVLGVANNVMLIAVFVLRVRHMALLERFGWAYLLLALPAAYALLLTRSHPQGVQYAVFLSIFLAFLALEGLFDFVLRLPFREQWRLLAPYLMLYFAMNYGFVVMSWKASPKQGLVMLALFVLQIAANIATH
ncbi:MAG: hypothetical protein H5U38_11295 [Calditrichaeota bacterium]|nr:hypothetical protein [Calditrichota bacterium]